MAIAENTYLYGRNEGWVFGNEKYSDEGNKIRQKSIGF